MKGKSPSSVVFWLIGAPLFFLSTAYVVAITDLGTQPNGPGIQAVGINNHGQKPSFISNTILVKPTPQARANLKVTGEDVNPAATGLPSLDVICRDHGVRGFHSIMTAIPHRDPVAAINAWFKLTSPRLEQRVHLVEPTNDDVLNLAYSSADPLSLL